MRLCSKDGRWRDSAEGGVTVESEKRRNPHTCTATGIWIKHHHQCREFGLHLSESSTERCSPRTVAQRKGLLLKGIQVAEVQPAPLGDGGDDLQLWALKRQRELVCCPFTNQSYNAEDVEPLDTKKIISLI